MVRLTGRRKLGAKEKRLLTLAMLLGSRRMSGFVSHSGFPKTLVAREWTFSIISKLMWKSEDCARTNLGLDYRRSSDS